jgi:uncharacterized protein YraI
MVCRIGVCFGVLVFFVSSSFAQEATTIRTVNLRADPSTANPAIKCLHSGTTLILLDPTQHGGFYHVKTEDGQEGWVWSKNISVSGVQAPAPPVATQCDDSLWDHVYNPQRLIVKQKCIAVTGTFVDATNGMNTDGVRHEADGDTHGWLKLDTDFTNLLNAGNLTDEGGNMVFEIVCKYRVTQADAKAACPPTYHNQVQLPSVGSHVRVVGTYVQDTNHAQWMEIHPVTSISVIP